LIGDAVIRSSSIPLFIVLDIFPEGNNRKRIEMQCAEVLGTKGKGR